MVGAAPCGCPFYPAAAPPVAALSIMLSLTDMLLITLSGLAAGFLNAVSGGGAMLTVPVLILVGLPPGVANGTNRLAVVLQSLTALAAYTKLNQTDSGLALTLMLPAMLGSVCGALVSVRLDDAVFQSVLAITMLVLLIPIMFEPVLSSKLLAVSGTGRGRRLLQVVFFGIGLYGGLLQIGAGILILVTLSTVGGLNLTLANGVKVVIVMGLTGIACCVFALNGKVDWRVGLLLSLTTSIGAWFGAHWGVSKGEGWIRLVLAGTIVVMALQLLGVWEGLRPLLAFSPLLRLSAVSAD